MSQDNPFFSVVIPVYNKEPYIARSIHSVLNQTFSDFELIVVCDPSTDNSNAEVEKFTDPRIRVFYRDEPGPGGYAARNLGIEKANGEWISFLDADDIYYPEHLMKIFDLSKAYPDVKLLSSSKFIEQDGRVEVDIFSLIQSEKKKDFTFKDYLRLSFLHDKPFNTNSIVIHNTVLAKDIKVFPDGRAFRSGDLYAWVKLIYLSKFFAWSGHIGSHTYKDIIGVSKTNTPSMILNVNMVNELSAGCSEEELLWLKRYANRLIKTAYFEQRLSLKKAEMSLFKALYWRNNFKYCLFWSILSLLPYNSIEVLRKLKGRLRFLLLQI
ncbi:glycosyltransferase family 2 protein [Geoalkalibacter halelectricus]|uniref:Glycosyltransferase family 2 protein n=1 Tax=Geoalkalibacter halelectricus TaxID=2847045 RepID=A0ABY5ZPF8_9BACT|nr:glycosyltransferase family 2 protein [Geoalkalibacter halelectricus]MDO3377830.1 glycosyltransferase family 2 protein [Geoalkalibacter halelectricus]UWZ79579.1 glycosyltransferase family 2 protein [Geoalkalibacter halelectricus]